jgi:riboflavin synthase
VFTGIVQAVGRVDEIISSGTDATWWIATGDLALDDVATGDSIAVNGCCLTAVAMEPGRFRVDLSPETLQVTLLGELEAGAPVNLEKALRLADRLGGHLVSGHVDGVANVLEWRQEARCVRAVLSPPPHLMRYIAAKGSVCIDGVSLTVNNVGEGHFELQLIPHTLEVTTLGAFVPGRRCHIEVDLIARYVERLQSAGWPPSQPLPA